jgi:hypothetical protein
VDVVSATPQWPRRDEVWLVSLNPSQGAEIQKMRALRYRLAGRGEPSVAHRDCGTDDDDGTAVPYQGRFPFKANAGRSHSIKFVPLTAHG